MAGGTRREVLVATSSYSVVKEPSDPGEQGGRTESRGGEAKCQAQLMLTF